MTARPRALLFDVFGTVVDWRGSLIALLRRFGERQGLAADWVGLADAWRAAYAPSMDRVRHGDLPWTKLDDLHRASLDRLLPGFGLAGLDDAARSELTGFWHRLDGWPDSVPGLARLRRDCIVAPLSNGHVALLVTMARHAGLAWDTVFGADLFRAYKPDPRTYLGACDLLGLASGAVMMCAAHNADLHAAAALGLRTAFIARPLEYGPAQTRDLAAEGPWDIVTDNLEALAGALGG
jgi:2-haloacid dehalogenase